MTKAFLSRRAMIGAAVGAAAATVAAQAAGQGESGHEAHNKTRSSGNPPDPKRTASQIPVAVMLDEASTMMDFAGPWEVFQDVIVGNVSAYHLYTVAPQMKTYNTTGNVYPGMVMNGLKFTPDFTYDNAPQPRIVVMGAQADFNGKAKVAWLRKVAPKAEVILSVCTGNFIAGYAGLLDGLKATTHHAYFDMFEKTFPRVQLIRDQRVVDNGKFVSGGGITAGIDAALHVVRRHFDPQLIQQTVEYMEYRGA